MIKGTNSLMNMGMGILIGSVVIGASMVMGPIIYNTVHNTYVGMQVVVSGVVCMPVGMLTGGALFIRAGALIDFHNSLIKKVKHEHNASGAL